MVEFWTVVLWLAIMLITLTFFWTAYQSTILVSGLRSRTCLKRIEKNLNEPPNFHNPFPKVSIIVPAKDEAKVIGRLLDCLVKQDYPNYEVIIVEDGSKDETPQICRYYASKYPHLIKYFHRDYSYGKPSAINFGAAQAEGEIIAVYDADTVIQDPLLLRRMVEYFKEPGTVAVQGDLATINPERNLTAKVTNFFSILQSLLYLRKDELKLFIPLRGNHQFIKKEVLKELGWWDTDALAEDAEISVRLFNKGYNVRYVPIVAYQEAPPSIREYVKQNVRWLRGILETIVKYAGSLQRGFADRFDVWMTLLSPIFSTAGFFGCTMVNISYAFFKAEAVVAFTITILGTLLVLTLSGLRAVKFTEPRKLVYIPITYIAWILVSILSTYACLLELFRRPRRWTKTRRG